MLKSNTTYKVSEFSELATLGEIIGAFIYFAHTLPYKKLNYLTPDEVFGNDYVENNVNKHTDSYSFKLVLYVITFWKLIKIVGNKKNDSVRIRHM